MSRSERYSAKVKRAISYRFIMLFFLCIALLTVLYFYSQSLIKIEAPKKDLGEKVIIHLPTGNQIFTYENLIVNEDGKLFYKGERNTLELTGGVVIYKDWKE
ncbi:hypothetical protein F7731_06575 [Cytobacillus depressus]|uniref:Uncharacterized protein n=1 Tax=Cytobacillus depressus TaxID=1602942 RepID=A0A6L3V908_9BACI|nr:hypothetical protein [Cytobacillus depressus]KAB2337275.1 hypothetical protein F7731_06575 [Cytobacillus depressus]